MNRWLLTLAFALVVLCPNIGHSASWIRGCQPTGGVATTYIDVGQWACNSPTSSTDDSGILGITSCENVDALFWSDVDGDAVASGATVQVRSCPTAVADPEACWIVENVTLDGLSATNTEAIYGFAGSYIYMDVTAYATPTEAVQLAIRCNGERQ